MRVHAVHAVNTWYITNNVILPVTSLRRLIPEQVARTTFVIGGDVAAMIEVITAVFVWEEAFIFVDQ